VFEDGVYVLELSGEDVDGDTLTFQASVDGNGSVSVEGSTLTVTPATNFNGSIVVSVLASDGQASGSGTFTLTVTPVNDAPVLSHPGVQTIDEDGLLTIDLLASDVDGDELIFSASADNNAAVDVVGSSLTVAPAQNYYGSIVVGVTVYDGYLSDSTSFWLNVTPINDAPELGDLADASVAEDNSYTLELSGTDIDGDTLTFQASVDGNGSVSVDGSTLAVTPAQDFNGDLTVSVIASDGQASGSGTFTLTVIPVNDAPVITSLDDQVIAEDTSLIFNISASDIDGDDLLKIKDVSSSIT
jgi:membrane protein implicated in regulation of membrane protease activity